MSRQARLSFIRADYYDGVRRRIMLDMEIGQCQLSKLYAYSGLMLSSGTRVDGIEIDRPHRVTVVIQFIQKNPGKVRKTALDKAGVVTNRSTTLLAVI